MTKLTQFYDRKMQYVNRFAGSNLNQSQNLATHGCLAALLYADLCEKEKMACTNKQLIFIMRHDIPETVTGDLLYPAKNHNSRVAHAWDTIEKTVIEEGHKELAPYLESEGRKVFSEHQWTLFKIADALEGFLFCKDEIQRGNISVEINSCHMTYEGILVKYLKECPSLTDYLNK